MKYFLSWMVFWVQPNQDKSRGRKTNCIQDIDRHLLLQSCIIWVKEHIGNILKGNEQDF